MPDLYSKLSSKSQTVIPRAIREKLGLRPGDRVRFRVTAKSVEIERARDSEEDDPFATFDEWNSDEDERLYSKL